MERNVSAGKRDVLASAPWANKAIWVIDIGQICDGLS